MGKFDEEIGKLMGKLGYEWENGDISEKIGKIDGEIGKLMGKRGN